MLGDDPRLPDEFLPLERLLYESILAGWFDSAMLLGRRVPDRKDQPDVTRRSLSDLADFLSQVMAGMLADPGFERIAGKMVFFPEIASAFEFLRDREILTPSEWSELSGVARRAAFTIAGVESRRALEGANELLQRAITEGWNRQQFADELDNAFKALGLTELSRSHTERIFRSAIAESRSRAHDEVLAKPFVGELFPFDRYDAIVDARSDETHKVLDGWVFLHSDPIWNSGEFPMRPPRRPNCRCTRTSLSVEQFLEQIDAGSIRYGSGAITIIDADGKEHPVTRDRGTGGVLRKAKITDTGAYSGNASYRVKAD